MGAPMDPSGQSETFRAIKCLPSSGLSPRGRATQFEDSLARGAAMRQLAPLVDVASMHSNSPRAQRSRSKNFWTLPEPVSGNSSRNTQ